MRIDEDVLGRVDNWRADQIDLPSRAEAMRRLLERGLVSSSNQSVALTGGEKLLAVMLGDIYKHLKIGKSEIDPEFVRDVIYGGHYWALQHEYDLKFHNRQDDPRDLKFVLNVLVMWRSIESGYGNLAKKDKALVENAAGPFGQYEFSGFDGEHDESAYFSIALFLIEKMNRFPTFKGRNLNSPSPQVATYRRMLSIFSPMQSGHLGKELGVAQIIAILKAMAPANLE